MHNISLRSLLINKGFAQYYKDPRQWIKLVGADALFIISSDNPDWITFNIQEFIWEDKENNKKFLNKTIAHVRVRDLSEINVEDPFEYIFNKLLLERKLSIEAKSDGKFKELQKLNYNLTKHGTT
jgi:hypothetical protein